ncbi:MAG TPA: ATP-grasp domain-containing protein, partial [Nitrospirales bacterium]|nr:ATP-grasp domain-containing protein [Nitrospirales bacterium]
PAFQCVSLTDDPRAIVAQLALPYPVVLKPLTLSASCGVIRANTSEECIAAIQRIATLLTALGVTRTDAGRQILLERFIPGREVAVEGLLTHGRLEVLAIFDKPDPLDGPFFEETLYVTPSRLPGSDQDAIRRCAAEAAAALGLAEGPVHAEIRVNADGPWVIEVAARAIGGRCSGTLHFAGDMSLEELILRHALRLELPRLDRRGASGVMMIPIPRGGVLRSVTGVEAARAVAGIETVEITAQPGDRLVPLPEGTRYLGFIRARGADPAEVESALRAAHGRLAFDIDAAEPRAAEAATFRF